jgi:2-methylcitrate dehydratase PrpD
LAAHIDVEKDNRVNKNGSTVTIDVGGETLCKTIDAPLGEPANWISDDRLRDKFQRHAGRIYGSHHAQAIAAAVLDGPLDLPMRELAGQLRLRNQPDAG